jgi:uncharacterized protein
VPQDFNYHLLDETAHRPWPMPDQPWIMTQTWHDLLFAHWPIDVAVMRAKVPASLELDLFEGQAWIAVVPFQMKNVTPRGLPALPWVSAFPELNVRTYVRIGDRPGVFFFSLDAANALAVATARTLFHLPYFQADMQVDVEDRSNRVTYASRRTSTDGPPAECIGTYRPVGPVFNPRPGSLEYFLTERYCLYAVDGSGGTHICEIHHPLWALQIAEAEFSVNSMARAAGFTLPDVSPLLHFAKRQDMVAFPLTRVSSAADAAR